MPLSLQKKLGATIRRLRDKRGLTREQLAEACDLSEFTIRDIEMGQSDAQLSTIARLAQGLNVSLTTIVEGVEASAAGERREIVQYVARLNERERKLAWRLLRAIRE